MKAIVVTDRRAASWVCAIHRDVCTGVCRTLCWRGFELVVPRQIGNGFEALSETAPSGRGARWLGDPSLEVPIKLIHIALILNGAVK